MSTNDFNYMVQCFFEALKKKTILIIIDSASSGDKAVFSLVSFTDFGNWINYAAMLKELGFKNYRNEDNLFVTYCAGRFSLFILDNIGVELSKKGIELPKEFFNDIQNQHHI